MRVLFALTVAWGFLIGDRDMKNADLSAMPASMIDTHLDRNDGKDESGRYMLNMGLTKREMFAMHAMQGLLSSSSDSDGIWTNEGPSFIASEAVAFADALLAELDK